ncbi:M14 family metallopeptidase [soil metagenome]
MLTANNSFYCWFDGTKRHKTILPIFALNKRLSMKYVSIVLLFVLSARCSISQSIPGPKDFLGYEIGSKFTPHYKIVQYYEALAKATPATMKLEQYGVTNGGRPLLLAYVSSAENISNLENIRTNNLQLAGIQQGGGTLNGKAIVWLSYNVHGNETSSSEAAMLTIYNLLTDAKSQEWLKNTVVIIDPCLNPDGRDRYVNWFNSVVGSTINPDPQSREHSEPWPGGRSNYYNFDLNRDWAWQTQVETQARIKKYNQWMPQVHVDYHEQGYNEPYYFAPAAEPFHEVITPWQRSFQTQIGRNNAKYFDQNGWLYFTKERFDLFYPSYGDTWPTYNGSIGMTYEQGGHSRGGLAIINEDGDTLTLRDRAMHHYTTGLATMEICAANAAALQKNFKSFFDNTNANGVGTYQSFVIKANENSSKLNAVKSLLDKNGIRYSYFNGGSVRGYNYFTGKDENVTLDKGDLVISTAQPHGTMAKVLFEPLSKLNDSATYDITAWAVPYVYGVQAYAVKEKMSGNTTPPATVPATVAAANAYGYVKTWNGMDDAKFLVACMKKGIKARMSERPFEVNGKKYAPGSLIFIKTSNGSIQNFDQTVVSLANEFDVSLDAVQTGFMDKGSDFGSPDVKTLFAPRVAMLTGETTSSLAAGEVWHFFDQQLKYPITLVNANEAGRVDWKRFNVLIVPDGNYKTLYAKDGDLKDWVQQGGKLILLENAVSQLAAAEWGLTARKTDTDDKAKEKGTDYALLKKYATAERDNLENSNPGSIFKVALDNTHPMAFGYPDYYYTLKSDDNVYDFMKDGWNVGVIKKASQVAGFTGVKAKEKLQDGVLFGELPMGRGSVIFFADDVLFRSFWENGKLMFANAVFLVNQGNNFRL